MIGRELYDHQIATVRNQGKRQSLLLSRCIFIIESACRLDVNIPIESIVPGVALRVLEKAYLQTLRAQRNVATTKMKAVRLK